MTDQTEYTISTVVYSGDLMPDGEVYAPQIVFTGSYGGYWNTTELNTKSLPFTAEEFRNAWVALGDENVLRWAKVFYGLEVITKETIGYSQGDYGQSFVFNTEEFRNVTGATRIQESDHNDLCAWIWGDVFEVNTKEITHTETCSLGHDHIITDEESEPDHIIYGMDEATKFANEHNIEIEGL